jgi:hypothetical protein
MREIGNHEFDVLPLYFSASIRRTSMRGEKRPLFKKEAKEEALHPFGQSLGDDDEIGDYMVRYQWSFKLFKT